MTHDDERRERLSDRLTWLPRDPQGEPAEERVQVTHDLPELPETEPLADTSDEEVERVLAEIEGLALQSASAFNRATREWSDDIASAMTEFGQSVEDAVAAIGDALEFLQTLDFDDLEPTRWERFCWWSRWFWLERTWFDHQERPQSYGYDMQAPDGEPFRIVAWRVNATRRERVLAHVKYFFWLDNARDRFIIKKGLPL